MHLKVLSYNMHKGRSLTNRKYVLDDIKSAIHHVDADIIFLQEVHGVHPSESEAEGRNGDSPLEHIADTLWPHHSYGQNAVYSNGHHGNAILSKYPIKFTENIDISFTPFAKRGLLHAVLDIPNVVNDLHVICVHLDLFEVARRKQIHRIMRRIRSHVSNHSPLLLAGDFNDWRQKVTPVISKDLDLKEAFYHQTGQHCLSFPSWKPLLPLDRIYYRGLQVKEVIPLQKSPWNKLSDHIPLSAHFAWE